MSPDAPAAASETSLRLAELMCARLCHDLSGAVGVMSSLLDLASSAAKEADEALAEARQTAGDLAARLIVLRAAWTAGEDMPLARLRGMAAPFLRQRRIGADLSGLTGPDPMPACMARAVLNMLLLCAEALPRGGAVVVSGSADGPLLFTIEGPGAAWPAALLAAAQDPQPALAGVDDPRRLQAPLAMAVAELAGLRAALLHHAGPGDAGAAPAPLLLDRAAARAWANGT